MPNPIKKFIAVVKNGYGADTAKVRSANRVSSTASDRRRVMKEPAITRAYNQSALARAVIDIPANMSLSQWRTWKADANHTEAITKAERELDIQRKMIQAHTIARKDGGAVIVIGTGEEDYSTPLDPSKIGRNGIEFLSVMTRYMFSRIDINLEPGTPGFGEALMFHLILTANPGASSMPREIADKDITMIHPSRLIILKGQPRLNRKVSVNMDDYWGDSVLQTLMPGIDQLEKWYDNTAFMSYEARTPVLAIGSGTPEGGGALSNSTESDDEKNATVEMLKNLNDFKGNTGLTVIDKDTMEFKVHDVNFTGFDKMIDKFVVRVSAESGIPGTILFGESPQGLNATGQSELTIFGSKIEAIQLLYLQPAMENLDIALIAHIGLSIPVEYDWNEIFETNDLDKARIFTLEATKVQDLIEAGTIDEVQGKAIIDKILVATKLGVA